jgi:hypothetical protein
MSEEEVKLTAYCGLYCGDCIRYQSKAADLARDLLTELEATNFGEYAEIKSRSMHSLKQLRNFRECCQVLGAIVELQCKEPCRAGGGCPTFSCDIVECCRGRGYQGCWECNDAERCSRFESLKLFHGENTLKNLKRIKESGLEGWAKYREAFFIWQQLA